MVTVKEPRLKLFETFIALEPTNLLPVAELTENWEDCLAQSFYSSCFHSSVGAEIRTRMTNIIRGYSRIQNQDTG